MLGLMMDKPLLISSVLDYAAKYHGGTEIVSRTVEGAIHRYTYAEALGRSKRLAQALQRLGIGKGTEWPRWRGMGSATLNSISVYPAWVRCAT